MASPMRAPTRTQIAPPSAEAADAWPTRNSEVSTPSRMTATKASTASALADPASSALSTAAWSSPLTLAAWRRIQNSIQVTTVAAAIRVAASNSCS